MVERAPTSSTALIYGGLKASDARGTALASQLRVVHGQAEIVVQLPRQAAYPLEIDPTWSSSSAPTATLSQGASDALFGWSVAMSGDGTTALVGAPDVGSGTGAAYIFHVTSEGSWATSSSPAATLSYSGGADGDQFGASVALSTDGTTALVGAPVVSLGIGAAYVFHVASEASWSSSSSPATTLTYLNGAPLDDFGSAVALSTDGSTALVGAYRVDANVGAAYVFHVASESSWSSSPSLMPVATLTDPGGAADASFGHVLALSADGTTALISGGGDAYIFQAPSEGAWASSATPMATLSDSATDGFPSALALSKDGTTALIGALGVGSFTGAAYIFHVTSEGSWASSSSPTATLTNSGGAANNQFGYAVAMSSDGTTAFIGAINANVGGTAYVFQVPTEASWTSSATPTATLTNLKLQHFGELRLLVGDVGRRRRSPRGSPLCQLASRGGLRIQPVTRGG